MMPRLRACAWRTHLLRISDARDSCHRPPVGRSERLVTEFERNERGRHGHNKWLLHPQSAETAAQVEQRAARHSKQQEFKARQRARERSIRRAQFHNPAYDCDWRAVADVPGREANSYPRFGARCVMHVLVCVAQLRPSTARASRKKQARALYESDDVREQSSRHVWGARVQSTRVVRVPTARSRGPPFARTFDREGTCVRMRITEISLTAPLLLVCRTPK